MNSHNPFDTGNPMQTCLNDFQSRDQLVDSIIGNSYEVVKKVYLSLGKVEYIYNYLQKYGLIIAVRSEKELRELPVNVTKYARLYSKSESGERFYVDYLYLEDDSSGIAPSEPGVPGSWVAVGSSGSSNSFIRIWYYDAESAGQTVINLPTDLPILAVQTLYVEGSRNDVGRAFTFNAETNTITLVDGSDVEVGTQFTVIIGVSDPDADLDIFSIFAAASGATLIGTASGKTVQTTLDEKVDTALLTSTSGAASITTESGKSVQAHLDSLVRRVNVLDFMSPAERNDVINYIGSMDVSDAFRQAFATGAKLIDVPSGIYMVSDVTIPPYTRLFGNTGHRPYNVTSDSSFTNTGTLIRKINGAADMFLWNTACGAQDIMFDGKDRQSSAINSVTGSKITVGFQRCGFYRWARVGNRNGAYLGCSFQFCNFNQNNIGIYNTIDGNHIGCTINANKSDGVRLETGADSNTFTNCRNEWNEGNNWNFYGCVSIQIVNEICDRAFAYGFRISNSNVQLINVDVRRSAKSVTNPLLSAHFFIENSIVKMIGVKTTVGVDDTGGNTTDSSPEYIFRMEGANAGTLSLLSCRLTGSKTGMFSGSATPATRRYTDNEGLDDFCNAGLYRKNAGKIYINYQTATGVGANGVTLAFAGSSVDTYSNNIVTVELSWRNTSSGGSNGAVIYLLFAREGGNCTISIMQIISKNGVLAETDVDTAPGANQLYMLTATPTVADGSAFELAFKAKSTNTANFQLRGYLK